MGLETALIIAATAGALGGVGSSIAANKAQKKVQANSEPVPASPKVEGDSASTADEKTAKRVGRAALLSTSPLGVTTTDPTGRRKILGN